MKLTCYPRQEIEKKMSKENKKWEGGNETLDRRGSQPPTLMDYISGPAGVVNDSTTPNSTIGDTTHAGAFM
jgi:hypothetical protein